MCLRIIAQKTYKLSLETTCWLYSKHLLRIFASHNHRCNRTTTAVTDSLLNLQYRLGLSLCGDRDWDFTLVMYKKILIKINMDMLGVVFCNLTSLTHVYSILIISYHICIMYVTFAYIIVSLRKPVFIYKCNIASLCKYYMWLKLMYNVRISKNREFLHRFCWGTSSFDGWPHEAFRTLPSYIHQNHLVVCFKFQPQFGPKMLQE